MELRNQVSVEDKSKVPIDSIDSEGLTIRSFFLPYGFGKNNPYQSQLAEGLSQFNVSVDGLNFKPLFLYTLLRQPRPTVLHIHWLHSFFAKSTYLKSLCSLALFVSQLTVLRLVGIKIIWTVHNLKNHDNKFLRLDKWGTAIVARVSHAIIAHGMTAKEAVVKTFRLKNPDKVFVIPHGNYIGAYINEVTRNQARQSLGLSSSEVVFLFLGLIRPYKGVIELIDVFTKLRGKSCKLLVAGKIWEESTEFRNSLEYKVAKNRDVLLIAEFIPDNELQIYFAACDVVVFPYKDILTSGAVLLAMSFGKACIAPRIGCITEVLDESGSFLYDRQEEHGLADAIRLAMEKKAELDRMGSHNFQLAEKYDWSQISEKTFEVYCNCF